MAAYKLPSYLLNVDVNAAAPAQSTVAPEAYNSSAATPQARHMWLYVAALAVVVGLIIWLIFFKK